MEYDTWAQVRIVSKIVAPHTYTDTQGYCFTFKIIIFTHISFFLNFLVLFNYSCVPFLPIPPPHPSQTPLPPSPPPSPLDFVHVSFIVVPIIPSPHCPLPTPPCPLLNCS